MTDTNAAAAEPAPAMLPLACPYCGGRLYVNQGTEGRPYLTYEVVESIECDDFKCGAAWEPDGAPRTPARWIAYPDLYSAPEPKDGR